ncbi:uncharacterized protein LOC132099287 [Carassius carassius]|uniref:uncharacterized protein LOC132099287 n=1 Tax=Carassius carassius TaxID=217509 RepID=UPI002868A565|nr:uncharacterized protein LOC132099287 [Carassius carassius]
MADPFCLSYFFRYIKQLKEEHKHRATTMGHKLVDLSHFFNWVKEAGPDGLRVSRKALKRAILIIKICSKEEMKHKQAWQQEVQMSKSENLLDPAAHAEFVRAASEVLPKVLQKLHHDQRQLDLFCGLLGGVMIATSGHRPCVIMNLTVEEFHSSKEGRDGHDIFVKKHKTSATFGHVILSITKGRWGVQGPPQGFHGCMGAFGPSKTSANIYGFEDFNVDTVKPYSWVNNSHTPVKPYSWVNDSHTPVKPYSWVNDSHTPVKPYSWVNDSHTPGKPYSWGIN